MRRAPRRTARLVAACGVVVLTVACNDTSGTPTTELPPADDTQPVNSMTNDSAMVPGAELEPVGPGGPPLP